VKPHERFIAWQYCHELALLTYKVTQPFPRAELYGITSQMRRAAASAAANIVEGCAKRGPAEFRRYLDIALGSLAELSYFALLSRDLGLMTGTDWAQFERVHQTAGKATMRLCRAMARRSSKPPNRPTA